MNPMDIPTPAEVLPVDVAAAWVHVDKIAPWPENPKYHPEVQINTIADLIRELGWGATAIVHVDTSWPVQLVAGHGRRLALLRILEGDPTFVVPGAPGPGLLPCRPHVVSGKDGARYAIWDESEDLALADNKAAEGSAWDDEALAAIMARKTDGRDLAAALEEIQKRTAFSERELKDLLRAAEAPKKRSDVSDPGARQRPEKGQADSRPGQVYQLGPHRLVCGDSCEPHHLEALLEGDTARPILVPADPPYGMGKEIDGVLNDNKRGEKLDAFNDAWWVAVRGVVALNASVYVWGLEEVLWRFWLVAECADDDGRKVQGLQNTNVTKRNLIVWEKPNPIGLRSPEMRCYPPSSERCLFFMRGKQALGNVNKDDFWEGFEDLRAWQEAQFEAMGWTSKDCKAITGVGMYGHWTGRSQWCIFPAGHYRTLQVKADGGAFRKSHRELREEYQALLDHPELVAGRQAFYATRSPFDNTHDAMSDVWHYERVQGEDRHGHATPKPLELCERMVLSSSRVGDVVLVPFGGSGPDLIACARHGRFARVVELDPGWCDVIRWRWTAWALAAGVDPGAGALGLAGSAAG